MATSTAAASKSGLYAEPRADWLALYREEIIDPTASDHRCASSFVGPRAAATCSRSSPTTSPPATTSSRPSMSIAARCTAQADRRRSSRSARSSSPTASRRRARAAAMARASQCGIVSHVNLLLGDEAKAVLEAQIKAGNGRYRGIRIRRPGMPTRRRRHVCDAAEGSPGSIRNSARVLPASARSG